MTDATCEFCGDEVDRVDACENRGAEVHEQCLSPNEVGAVCPYCYENLMNQDEEADLECSTCRGTGIVNELTPNLPKDFLCLAPTECPHCDGTGEIL